MHGAGDGVVDVHDGAELVEAHGVAGLVGEPDRASEVMGGTLGVPGVQRFEPVVDRAREVCLAGGVGDVGVQPGAQLLVIGPFGEDVALGRGLAVDHEQRATGEHALADRAAGTRMRRW